MIKKIDFNLYIISKLIIMPKNSSNKGSKSKGSSRQSSQLREREEKDGEYYADVIKPLGDGQFRIQVLNGNEEIAKLKGSMRKGRGFDKVVTGNLVLVQLDPTTTTKDKFFIIHNYDDKEKKQLEK